MPRIPRRSSKARAGELCNEHFETDCRLMLERFYNLCPDAGERERAMSALSLLMKSEPLVRHPDGVWRRTRLRGKSEGWAAGIVYALRTMNPPSSQLGQVHATPRIAGLTLREFEELMGASLETIRHRAARVQRVLRQNAAQACVSAMEGSR